MSSWQRWSLVAAMGGALSVQAMAACSSSSGGPGGGAIDPEGGASGAAGAAASAGDTSTPGGSGTGGGGASASGGTPAVEAGAPAVGGHDVGGAPSEPAERCLAGDDGTLGCVSERLLVGTAVNMGVLPAVPEYAELVAAEFGYLTPENVMKWGPLQPTADTWDFAPADDLLAFAREHGQAVKGHALVWHIQQPAWADALSAPALRSAVETHVKATVAHFKGKLRAWDVVNEAVLDSGNGLRPGLHTVLGVAGMANVFKWTREIDPEAKLYYNDYGIESLNDKSDAVYRLLQELLAAGAPIDGIGFQAHVSTKVFPSLRGMRENIKRFAELGLSVNVSELDVRTVEVPETKAQRLASQAIVYRELAAACSLEQACDAVTLWGFTDAHSWIDSEFGADDPLPWDESYAKKPAHAALLQGLSGMGASSGPELVADGGCDTATGWVVFGGGTLASVANGRTGNACRVSARTQPYHGPGVNLTGKVSHAATVTVSGYARLASPTGGRLNLVLKKAETGVADEYLSIAHRVVASSEWTLLSGSFTLGFATAPTELVLYVESPAVDAAFPNLLLDDLTIKVLSN